MKKYSKFNFKPTLLFICLIVTLMAFISPKKYNLTGQWSILNQDGTPSGEFVNFNQDHTYTVALPNGQIGERGNYRLKDSVFSIRNIKNVCGKNYWGQYKLTFYGNDSVHLTLIQDSCTARRMDMVGYNPGLKRRTAK